LLAFALRRRFLATLLLVVTTIADALVAVTPVGGVVQQVVMAVAILVKPAALVLLWRSPRHREDLVPAERSSLGE
jgi:hypothetical protein